MKTFFSDCRRHISGYLTSFLAEKGNSYRSFPLFGPDLADRILAFTLPGKMIRGGLVYLAAELYGSADTGKTTAAAAAMELFQSGFLIHDDIMDRDYMRRGQPSLFAHYEKRAAAAGISEALHTGEALGICAGDACWFLAQELLAQTGHPEVMTRGGSLLTRVCLAQMEDVWYGSTGELPTEEAILSLYVNKTGCYTFSLPLITGALIAFADSKRAPDSWRPELARLERLGELAGILFQVRDDELGLFGTEADTGKPAGSDIREGKKTLWFCRLLDACSTVEKKKLLSVYGNPDVGAEGIAAVAGLLNEKDIRTAVGRVTEPLKTEAQTIIADLEGLPEPKSILGELLDWCTSRNK